VDLVDELRVISMAQYFLDSFYNRAKLHDVTNLPGKSFTFLTVLS